MQAVEPGRWERPLPLPGGSSRRRLVSFSPKLGRRLVLGSYAQRKVWLALEANPRVSRFCERPCHLQANRGRMVDYWVQFASGAEEFWLIDLDGPPADAAAVHAGAEPEETPVSTSAAPAIPKFLHDRRVRRIDSALIDSWNIPLANWERIVSQLTAWRRYRDALLEQRIIVMLGVPLGLSALCARLPEHDPHEVEAAMMALLAEGRVQSPELAQQHLDEHTPFRRI